MQFAENATDQKVSTGIYIFMTLIGDRRSDGPIPIDERVLHDSYLVRSRALGATEESLNFAANPLTLPTVGSQI